jgi:hypothetical protein
MTPGWTMRRGTRVALALTAAALLPLVGCRKAPPEETDLRRAATPAASAVPTVNPSTPLLAKGRLDVSLVPRPVAPAKLLLLLDRSVAASFSIESLKQSLSMLMDRIPPDLPIGIRAFPGELGEASVLLSPVTTGDRTTQKLKILEMNPGGAGSFSRAMLDASVDFIGEGDGCRVILIAPPTKETVADRDPCATARTLRRMAERISVDVVEILPSYLGQVLPGFDAGGLACIAREGGGRYLQVGDPGQVDAAVWAMVEEARSSLVVSALLSEGKALAGDSAASGGSWGATLYPSGSLSPVRSTGILPVSWAVPPGDYSLRVWYKDLSGTVDSLRIVPGQALAATVNLHAAELAVRAVDVTGREIEGDFRTADCATRWELRAETGEVVGRGCLFPGKATVQAGSFSIHLVSDRYAAGEGRVEVAEGGVTAVTLVEGSAPTPPPEAVPAP